MAYQSIMVKLPYLYYKEIQVKNTKTKKWSTITRISTRSSWRIDYRTKEGKQWLKSIREASKKYGSSNVRIKKIKE